MPPKDPHVVAVACADIHLSDEPPKARKVDGVDWYKVQAAYLDQLSDLCVKYGCPCLIAGDVFDDGWRPRRCTPRLINLAIDHLPTECYAVPGQHDLQHHRLDQLKRSAFWTLVKAGKITYLEPGKPLALRWMVLHGFPWSAKPAPTAAPHSLALDVAVIHRFVWTQKTGYPGAPEDGRYEAYRKVLRGYDVAVFGDNHKPVFRPHPERCSVFNPGSFMRRRRDEVKHRPRVGLIHAGGEITRHYLDTAADQFADTPDDNEGEAGAGVREVLEELSALGGDEALDFGEALRRWKRKHKPPDAVWQIILEWLGGSDA